MILSEPSISLQMVSLWTCSETCEIFFYVGIVTGFVVGIVVGYELKTRVRRWLLSWLKDD
ncbi:hypothetical protein NC651_016162 [Populus alba x Populus x berolinensis]|nr:hypothetical protein NC651_016162 [Populus alba x Populus x berolinensis]